MNLLFDDFFRNAIHQSQVLGIFIVNVYVLYSTHKHETNDVLHYVPFHMTKGFQYIVGLIH